jgi:hypothetical protein
MIESLTNRNRQYSTRNIKRLSPKMKELRADFFSIIGTCATAYVVGQIIVSAWCNA